MSCETEYWTVGCICLRTELAAAAALGRGSGAEVPRPAKVRLERVCAWRLRRASLAVSAISFTHSLESQLIQLSHWENEKRWTTHLATGSGKNDTNSTSDVQYEVRAMLPEMCHLNAHLKRLSEGSAPWCAS